MLAFKQTGFFLCRAILLGFSAWERSRYAVVGNTMTADDEGNIQGW